MKEKASGKGGDRETAGEESDERRTVWKRWGQENCRQESRMQEKRFGKDRDRKAAVRRLRQKKNCSGMTGIESGSG